MKKILVLFSLIILVGAGCAGAPDLDELNTQADANSIKIEHAENEMEEEMDEMMGDMEEEMDEMMGDMEEEMDEMMGGHEEDEQQQQQQQAPQEVSLSMMNVDMKSGNFFFEPALLEAEPGATVNITFTENAGFHTIVIDEINFKKTVEAGETISFTAPLTPGSYSYYCDVGSHRALGMEGILTVK